MRNRRLNLALLSICAVPSLLAQSTGNRTEFTKRLVAAAVARSQVHVRYVADYVRIPYPGGDVPADTGTCTDEIIRSYRAVGIDLQKEVHEDMLAHLDQHPNRWKWWRRNPDSNIDHRRVPNLMVFFKRNGEDLPITHQAADCVPGDVVTWDLGNGQTHIGIVVDRKARFFNRYMILHNIGRGPQIEDVLFDWKITGHFRYYGPNNSR
jgi:uncharacterized protein YijF (DUF1287 family)